MPADFAIFGVSSRRDAFLESLFNAPEAPKAAAIVDDMVDKDDPFEHIKAAFLTRTCSRVWVDEHVLKTLGEELRYYITREEADGTAARVMGLPLNFGTEEDEIGFTFLMEALRFGSCYDRLLEERMRSKRGARETIEFGLIAMFISGKPPHTADNLINCSTKHEISTTFDFPIHESRALDFANKGGVYQDVDGPLEPFASAISKCMSEMGVLLRSRQLEGLGHFALKLFAQAKDKKALTFTELLTKALPVTFGDEQDGVAFRCKAQRLAYVLHRRFPARFPFEHMNRLTGFADSSLVFALRKLGVIKLQGDLESSIDAETPKKLSLGGKDELALRVGALYAVRRMSHNLVHQTRACEWLVDKGTNIVHQKFRPHFCETFAY